MLKNKSLYIAIITAWLFCQALPAFAVKPRFSTHESKGRFERGHLDKVSILHKGTITLAPKTEKFAATGDPFIWSAVTDSKGNVFLGTGNDGKIYRYSAKGDSSLFFDPEELQVYTLAVDKNDNIYAGTSPNGKIYKITPQGEPSVFFDPKELYIWDMAFDENGVLYVTTGASAAIYKVTTDGNSSLAFKSEQTHIRSLCLNKGHIYAGSSGNGYIYDIDQNGKAFVILDTQMQEVQDILVTADGTIYAAAFGESTMPVPGSKTDQDDGSNGDAGQEGENEEASFAQSFLIENLGKAAQTPSALYRINPNGYAKDLWIGSDERIQSLLEDRSGNILVGTGNKGKLYSIDKQGNPSLILTTDESQITALAHDHDQNLVIGTSNLGVAYWLQNIHVSKAAYESETIDTGQLSWWGTLDWEGKENDGSLIFYTRSGNTEQPEQTWSEWQKVNKKDGPWQIVSPCARFLQWKCDFSCKENGQSPEIHKVTIASMQKNFPPSVTDIVIHRPGDTFEMNISKAQKEKGIPYPQQANNEESKDGFRSIDWLFEDPNFDGIIFDLYYQKSGSKYWAPMVKNFAGNYYTWDSRQMSDGYYTIKIIAKDSLANPVEMAQSGEMQSEPFIIDNTGPQISSGKTTDTVLKVSVIDQLNPVKNVYFSINTGNWQMVYPIDKINDSKHEQFEVPLGQAPLEIAIKAEDSVGNISIIHKNID